MALLGHVAQGAAQSSVLSGDTKYGLKVQTSEDGLITSLFVDMVNSGSEIQAFRAGVYNDATTISTATLVDQSDVVLLAPGATRSWVAFNSGISAPITAGSFYWLVLHAGLAGGNASFFYDAGAGNYLSGSDTFSDGLAATFGAGTITANSLAVYASYTPASVNITRGLGRIPTYAGWK